MTSEDRSKLGHLVALFAGLGTVGCDANTQFTEACELATSVALAGVETYVCMALQEVPDGVGLAHKALTGRALDMFVDLGRIAVQGQSAILRATNARPNPETWARAALAAHVTPQALVRMLEFRGLLEAQRRASGPAAPNAALVALESGAATVLVLCMVRPSLAAEVLRHLGMAAPEDLRALDDLEAELKAAYQGQGSYGGLLRSGFSVVNRLHKMRAPIPSSHREAKSYAALIDADAPPDVIARHMACQALHAVVLGTFVRCTRIYHELPEGVDDACVPAFFTLPSLVTFEPDIFTQESLNA